jgi:plasmid stabilization system protein ParE
MPRASNDIVALCEHIERDSPQNAASIATRLFEAIDSLDIFPHRYEVHISRRDRDKTVRSMAVPPFIVCYRVSERKQAVEVVTVRHGSQRQPSRFD